jgi:hypothetical protein
VVLLPWSRSFVNKLVTFCIRKFVTAESRAMLVPIIVPGCNEQLCMPSPLNLVLSDFAIIALQSFAEPYLTEGRS